MINTKRKKKNKKKSVPFPERVSTWVGSTSSLALHTILFIFSFLLIGLGVPTEEVLLVLTTIVSLEAIYLAIFIQMTVNKNTASLAEVEEDLDEIQEDLDEIQEDVGEIQGDIDEIQEDVDEIQEDVDGIQESHEDLAEDIDVIEDKDTKRDREINEKFTKIDQQLETILNEIKKPR